MKTKIKVALIHKSNYPAFQPDFFERSSFNFFMHALKRNQQMEILYFGVDGDYFDTTKLQDTCDIILLANNYTDATPETLDDIQKIGIPVICRTGDPHSAKRFNQISYHKKWKIDY